MTFEVGDILVVKTPELPDRKTKYVVCVCVSHRLGLYINSENREMYDCIILKKTKKRRFLKNDSYIACKNLHKFQKEQVQEVVGCIEGDEVKAIIEKINASKTISSTYKKLIIESLGQF